MDNRTRQRIAGFIGSHPGSSARAIQRGLNLGWGETSYHLQEMVKGGTILKHSSAHRDYYFSSDVTPADRATLSAMQSPMERRILVELSQGKEVSFSELLSRIPGGRSTVAFHLRYLIVIGQVAVLDPPGERRYRAQQPERVLRLYRNFRDSFGDRMRDEFTSIWGALVHD